MSHPVVVGIQPGRCPRDADAIVGALCPTYRLIGVVTHRDTASTLHGNEKLPNKRMFPSPFLGSRLAPASGRETRPLSRIRPLRGRSLWPAGSQINAIGDAGAVRRHAVVHTGRATVDSKTKPTKTKPTNTKPGGASKAKGKVRPAWGCVCYLAMGTGTGSAVPLHCHQSVCVHALQLAHHPGTATSHATPAGPFCEGEE